VQLEGNRYPELGAACSLCIHHNKRGTIPYLEWLQAGKVSDVGWEEGTLLDIDPFDKLTKTWDLGPWTLDLGPWTLKSILGLVQSLPPATFSFNNKRHGPGEFILAHRDYCSTARYRTQRGSPPYHYRLLLLVATVRSPSASPNWAAPRSRLSLAAIQSTEQDRQASSHRFCLQITTLHTSNFSSGS